MTRVISLPLAFALSLVLASHVAAASWGTPIAFDTGVSFAGIAGISQTAAVAVYSDETSVYARRTVDTGETWKPPVLIASDAFAPSIAARGLNVHVVFHTAAEVWYTRSTDGGASFLSPIQIAGPNSNIVSSQVAVGPDGLAAIMWDTEIWYGEDVSKVIRITVSTNGGSSFGTRRKVVTFPGAGGSALAVGKGVIYVAYQRDYALLRVVRSLNLGSSWSAPAIVNGDTGEGDLSLTAQGTTAYLAFQHQDFSEENWGSVRYVRTTNRGGSWSAPISLTSHKVANGQGPIMLLRNGVVHAFYQRDAEVVYRRSTDGVTWSPREPVQPLALPQGIAVAGTVLALYQSNGASGWTSYVERRLP